jgi:hypothetical protein
VSQLPEAQPVNPGHGEPSGMGAPQTDPSQAKPGAQPKPAHGSPAPGSLAQIPGSLKVGASQKVPAAHETKDVSLN